METMALIIILLLIAVIIGLAWLLFWVGGILFTLRKGLNEVIQGLVSIDAELQQIRRKIRDDD